jgi:hypothetical protein
MHRIIDFDTIANKFAPPRRQVNERRKHPIARTPAAPLARVCRSLEARKSQGLGAAQQTDRAASCLSEASSRGGPEIEHCRWSRRRRLRLRVQGALRGFRRSSQTQPLQFAPDLKTYQNTPIFEQIIARNPMRQAQAATLLIATEFCKNQPALQISQTPALR